MLFLLFDWLLIYLSKSILVRKIIFLWNWRLNSSFEELTFLMLEELALLSLFPHAARIVLRVVSSGRVIVPVNLLLKAAFHHVRVEIVLWVVRVVVFVDHYHLMLAPRKRAVLVHVAATLVAAWWRTPYVFWIIKVFRYWLERIQSLRCKALISLPKIIIIIIKFIAFIK